MAPKMLENWSKNRPGADLGPLILGFLAFWHDAKNSRIFGTPLVAPKIGKIGPRSGQEASFPQRRVAGLSPTVPFSGIWAPGRPRVREAKSQKPKAKGYWHKGTRVQGYKGTRLQKREQGFFKGSNTPKAKGLANFCIVV